MELSSECVRMVQNYRRKLPADLLETTIDRAGRYGKQNLLTYYQFLASAENAEAEGLPSAGTLITCFHYLASYIGFAVLEELLVNTEGYEDA